MKLLSVLTFVVFIAVEVQADCYFEDYAHLYHLDKAKDDALRDYSEGNLIFYEVANGIGPDRPGFDAKNEEHKCLIYKARNNWVMLWLGGDVRGVCKDFSKSNALAMSYAEIYNKEALKLFKGIGENCLTNSSTSGQ